MQTPQARNLTISFVKKEQVASDTWSFYFDKTAHPFTHLPGQYIRMTLPHEHPDDRGINRFFTLASSPLEEKNLMITTKHGTSSFKQALFALQPGTQVTLFGPLGTFVLHDDEAKPLVLLAGGIGITPFHSMLTYAATKNLSLPITLFVSFSKAEEMIFYQELQTISTKQHTIKTIYTITHPEKSQSPWQGETGRISDVIIRKYVPNSMQAKYYVVGSTTMVEGTKELLIHMGIPAEQILTENFPGY